MVCTVLLFVFVVVRLCVPRNVGVCFCFCFALLTVNPVFIIVRLQFKPQLGGIQTGTHGLEGVCAWQPHPPAVPLYIMDYLCTHLGRETDAYSCTARRRL